MDTSLLSPKPRQTLEMYALKASYLAFTRKILDLNTSLANDASLGLTERALLCSEPDQLRGPQHSLAWCDELAKWQYAEETWDQIASPTNSSVIFLRNSVDASPVVYRASRPLGIFVETMAW
jgi:hypothetical protein